MQIWIWSGVVENVYYYINYNYYTMLYSPTVTIIILCYIVPQWLFSDIETNYLTILLKNLFRAWQIMSWHFWIFVSILSATKM